MSRTFSILNRKEKVEKSISSFYDLIVIGGGVTGCGIALDATSRGMKVLLVEKTDFAAGTSSKSTKLIHGGLRYLKQLEFGLVRETGLERAIVHKLAPHLVHPEKMLLPIVDNGTFNKWTASLAISVYDFLAGVNVKDRKRTFNRERTLLEEPLLNAARVKSGIQYSEYRTDDARITIELIKKANSLGCDAYNYCEVIDLIYDQGKVNGVRCRDHIANKEIAFYAKHIVSAAGPWVDQIRIIDQSKVGKSLRLTKGVHIVIPKKKFDIRHAVYFDAFDGRMLFAIPRGNTTYIGTSDTDYHESLDNVTCTAGDTSYLLKAINAMFPSLNLVDEDVISSWAGLRPLVHEDGKAPSEVSRKDEIFESQTGLISIAGGKLTGYRKMAQRIVNLVNKKQGNHFKPSNTRKLKLTDTPFENYKEVKDYIKLQSKKLGHHLAWYLTTVYGKATEDILILSRAEKGETMRHKIMFAEIRYTIDHESVANPIDFYQRRTGMLYFDIGEVIQSKNKVLSIFENIYKWNEDELNKWSLEVDNMLDQARSYRVKDT